MSPVNSTIRIATRGSALALVQANFILRQCREAFPNVGFELSILKTTGDRLQNASLSTPNPELPKGLFTKELEVALMEGRADLAVHSLKDLPTELPAGLKLGAVSRREDARDVLIYRSKELARSMESGRGFDPGIALADLPEDAVVATSSTRREAQLKAVRPTITVTPIRGNVGTRMRRLKERPELDATILASAGLRRLGFGLKDSGEMAPPQDDSKSAEAAQGLLAAHLDLDLMLPCVGQAAIGVEIREDDPRLEEICARLNDPSTLQCVTAERSFLRAMGGGCLSPIAAFAERRDSKLTLKAVSFRGGSARRADGESAPEEAEALGRDVAARFAGEGANQ